MTRCFVYRCGKQDEQYVFLANKDGFDVLPDALQKRLGALTYSFDFELDETRRMVRDDPKAVLHALNTQGFYLRLNASEDARDA